MKPGNRFSLLGSGLLVWLALISLSADAATAVLWTGPTIDFTQSDDTPADVILPNSVVLTRDLTKPLYNIAPNFYEPQETDGSPTNTEWAFGELTNYASLNYQSMDSMQNGNMAALLINGGPMVMHIKSENIYLFVQFLYWGRHGSGGFEYLRSTPAPATNSPITLTAPRMTNGTISFAYNVDPGSRYIVQRSTNLVNWVTVATNAASSNQMVYSESLSTNRSRYYRVGRLPTP